MRAGTQRPFGPPDSEEAQRAEGAAGETRSRERAPGRVSLAQASAWLAAAREDPSLLDELGAVAGAARDAIHGRRIRLFAPLYYANVCVNDCLYCGFRRENRTANRRVLSPGEIAAEAEALLEMGHRRILLVASEDPSARGRALVLDAARAVRSARHGGASASQVAMEVAPGTIADFRAMAEAGVDAYVLFQETYDRRLYGRVHVSGPKSDFDWRLGAPERALAGGIPHVGLGVLLGLGDPRREVLGLIGHARRIERRSGRPPRTVSLPRLRPAEGSDLSRHPYRPVSDELLLAAIAVVRLALPRTGIVLSSREPAALRDRALDFGVTELSAGSRTDPGGYTAERKGTPGRDVALAQFEVEDRRGFDSMVTVLRDRGYEPLLDGDPSDPVAAGRSLASPMRDSRSLSGS